MSVMSGMNGMNDMSNMNNMSSMNGANERSYNKKFLNITTNTTDTEQRPSTKFSMVQEDIQNINSISKKYNYVNYLGKGKQGDLFLLNDIKKNRYICKKILLNGLTPDDTRQIEFELAILKYLSSNPVIKPFVNPCLHTKKVGNSMYSVFPVINGVSLVKFKKHLNKLSKDMYYQIAKKIFRNLLYAMGNIHNSHVAHQNIEPSSILISILPENDIGIKFTDFGLGCGRYHTILPENDTYNVKKNSVSYQKCGVEGEKELKPIKITKQEMERLGHSDYLKKAQNKDCWDIGLILFELLLPGYLQKIHKEKGIDLTHYTPDFNLFVLNDIVKNYPLDNDHHEYVVYLFKYLLVESKKRKSCNYVLDKLITALKYD